MTRLAKLRAAIGERGIDAYLALTDDVRNSHNVRYLSGFTGTTAHILVTATKAYFFCDSRYTAQAKQQAVDFEVLETNYFIKEIEKVVKAENIKKLAFEENILTWDLFTKYNDQISAKFVPSEGTVEAIRAFKEDDEIEAIQRACVIADKAYEHILTFVQPGQTEKEVALELEFFMRRLGAEKLAFDTIVASGWRSALPHGVASDKVIEEGDMVTIDFGCFVDGYCSDITRSFGVGKLDCELVEIYETVQEAQARVIKEVKPGMTGAEVDAIARDYIESKSFGKYFGHGLGHSIGLEVHEDPRFSPSWPHKIEPGMVITDEPGIYIEGLGGVRIEDDLLITEDGCFIFNKAPKELIEIEIKR
ncbi:MAG: aminopeptidase P family protein [Lactobacillales bacterium]|jgi:Xaa-Pro aminopeptidase|nr:aminopeptidase P family protein [Lactobacillales bacterium]